MKVKRKMIVMILVITVLLGFTSMAGFLGRISFQGSVTTAYVEFDIESYSGTWVYKNLSSSERIILDYESDNPDYLLVSSSWAEQGTQGFDVDFYFENIYPCIFFKADFIAHYIGSLPVHIQNISFTADPWLQQYLSWNIYSCEKIQGEYIIGEPVQLGYQLHNCMYIYVEIIVKLPQDNSLQNLNGYFQGQLEVIQWDDYCDKILNLPDDTIIMTASKPGQNSYFDIVLSSVPSGYHVTDGLYLGWCIDQSTNMLLNTPIMCTLYSSCDPIIQQLYPDDDWDLVNYLINHKHPNATTSDIQDAIWYFIDGGGYPSDVEAQSMVDNATLYGEGFQPSTGEWCAVYVLNQYQQIFIEVDP